MSYVFVLGTDIGRVVGVEEACTSVQWQVLHRKENTGLDEDYLCHYEGPGRGKPIHSFSYFFIIQRNTITQAVQKAATTCPAPASWPFDPESGVWVTYHVSYLCANISTSRPVCSRLRPDVCDRQTSDGYHRLMPPTLGVGHNKWLLYAHFWPKEWVLLSMGTEFSEWLSACKLCKCGVAIRVSTQIG